MTIEKISTALDKFKDLREAPLLRVEKEKLETALTDANRVIRRKDEKITDQNLVISRQAARIEELEAIRVKVGKEKMSLSTFQRRARSQIDVEIRKQIASKANISARQMLPGMVKAEINSFPNNCQYETRELINNKSLQLLDQYLKDPKMWPGWFNNTVNSEATNRAEKLKDKAFWSNVKLQADNEINQRLPYAWNGFLANYATKFTQNSIQSQLLSLSTTVELICHKCGGVHLLTLTPDDLSILIRTGKINVPCMYCKGLFKPKMTLTLGALFWLIQSGDITPIRILNSKVVKSSYFLTFFSPK